MEWKTCNFCGKSIEPGTGKKFVKKDGSVMFICSSKCEKNYKLKRVARKLRWTPIYYNNKHSNKK
ncbi:50S ribosomal protein L24e [Methanococcus aeolicus]|uniref:Large ribosomal subunit protein eL24 n=1 Tax=Methanococcus aeolicus (strain ATCC BAA-1280 / DSM 17508 / OCM 812 / Nankai-3) TaxID=419665 RepID=RL24E_META3|nr:50S ribosomal protein L24e [Methanococcus aeolicus]A6UT49.1 RecName: Full=Large ribosomal subunit protein eL24; AltName: Full=50S ribosomal protein L24e [Methanococcus aeolicus Nankai-3]ABR55671.1 Ribosomal protein L24E [Methanococcus aeolicus Nankai-3]UXM85170.1 50S ribosomal protein L24e [Methanococcus aeolicus]